MGVKDQEIKKKLEDLAVILAAKQEDLAAKQAKQKVFFLNSIRVSVGISMCVYQALMCIIFTCLLLASSPLNITYLLNLGNAIPSELPFTLITNIYVGCFE